MAAKTTFDIPKADALREGIMKRVNEMKENLSSEINASSEPINLVIDAWTAPNFKSYIAV
jgi:hypothetical protein